jgi:hypothetical protein
MRPFRAVRRPGRSPLRTLRAFDFAENQICKIKANSMNKIKDRGVGKANSKPNRSQSRGERASPLSEAPWIL